MNDLQYESKTTAGMSFGFKVEMTLPRAVVKGMPKSRSTPYIKKACAYFFVNCKGMSSNSLVPNKVLTSFHSSELRRISFINSSTETFVEEEGLLFCFSPVGAALLWSGALTGTINGSPSIARGLVDILNIDLGPSPVVIAALLGTMKLKGYYGAMKPPVEAGATHLTFPDFT